MNKPAQPTVTEFTDANRQIGAIYDNLMNDPADIANCPESLFVKMFLPFFSGNRVVESEGLAARWIALAGNCFKPVNVFKDDTSEILYTVPPFFDMDAVVVSNRKHGSLGQIINTASQLSQIHPSQGVNHFAKEVSKLELLQDRTAQAERTKQIFYAIFERYGVKPVGWEPLTDSTKPGVAAAVSDASQVDFDDGDTL